MINFFDVLELLCVLILLKIELEGKYNIKREREKEEIFSPSYFCKL